MVDPSGLSSLAKLPVATSLKEVVMVAKQLHYSLETLVSDLPKKALNTSSLDAELRMLELLWVRMRGLVVSHMLNLKHLNKLLLL